MLFKEFKDFVYIKQDLSKQSLIYFNLKKTTQVRFASGCVWHWRGQPCNHSETAQTSRCSKLERIGSIEAAPCLTNLCRAKSELKSVSLSGRDLHICTMKCFGYEHWYKCHI